jgi:predicted DsbA family dithiol-disulfide isomerase
MPRRVRVQCRILPGGKAWQAPAVGVGMQVEIWSDVVCPWCYLGKRRFERALESFPHREEVDVVYRSFELDPSAPTEASVPTVQMLASKYGMTVSDAEQAQRQMEERAAADGLSFRMGELRSGSTKDAHRLIQLAKADGKQEVLVERLHRAYFCEQDSIFDHDSLTRLATEAGLDKNAITQVLTSDDYADAVEADEMTARQLGATGVPFFVIDRRYGVAGAQPVTTLSEALTRAWADEHSSKDL